MKTKYALVNDQRQKPQPGLKGKCQVCGQPMIAKCGEIKIHHWAHKGYRQCDTWWERETEWHRAWKGQFPDDWQEVVHIGENGEKHIADVKTDEGWVIEFQHSYLNPEERRSRDTFYPKLVWVVDGTRRKNDRKQFFKAHKEGKQVGDTPIVTITEWDWDECRILREWSGSDKHIFFDFGEDGFWWLFAKFRNGTLCVTPFLPTAFIEIHSDGGFDERVIKIREYFQKQLEREQVLKQLRLQPTQEQVLKQYRPDPLQRLQQSYARKSKPPRRVRRSKRHKRL